MDYFVKQYLTWLLLVPLLLLSQLANSITYNGVVSPDNNYVFIGDMFVLNCTISDLRLGKASQLVFTHNKTMIIPAEFTHKLDSSTLQLSVNITSPRDAGTYTCLIRSTAKHQRKVIGQQFLQVEYKVQSVKNIDCKVYNWEKMTCIWDLGADYIDKTYMNFTLGWTISKRQYNCLHQTPTSCTWITREGDHSFQPDKGYQMQISVRNRRKDIIRKSKIFYIDSSLIVQPGKLRSIKCRPFNSSCVNLSWNQTHRLLCRIRYHSQWDSTTIWKEMNTTRKQVLLCGLTPFTLYNISVSCLPPRTKRAFWSDKTRISFKTPSEVPEKPPHIPGTYYSMPPKGTKDCSQVVLYWRRVGRQFQYGKPQGFLIQYRPRHGNWQEVQVRQGLTSAMICLSTEKAYELRLYARNDVNFSTGYSTLFIETENKKPGQPPNFTAETLPMKGTNLFNLTLTWGTPTITIEGLKSWQFLLMWCHKSGNHVYNCKDNPQWIHLPSWVRDYSMDIREHSNLIFGLATKATFMEERPRLEDGTTKDYGKNISSGLVWASCIFRKDLRPLEAPSDVKFGGVKDQSLRVSWQPLRCEESPTKITEYLIYYCSVNSSQTCYGTANIAHVKGNDSSYIIAGLTPGLRYRVWLQAISAAGKGPETHPIYSMVIDERLTSEAILGITAAIAIIFAIIIIGCVSVYKKVIPCRRKYNGMEIDCHIDNLPSLPDEPLFYDDEFDRKSFRHQLPSTKSYDSDDRCSVHTQNSPTAETPLINEPKRRTKVNKLHSPKLPRSQQPTSIDKRTSATWSPRGSANLEAIPAEYYLDGSRSSPVTLSKPGRGKSGRAVFDAPDSQASLPQPPSLLDSYTESAYTHDSIETIHPIRPLNDGYSYVIPSNVPFSGWTSRSSLDTPSQGNGPFVGSNGNLVYSRTGISSNTLDSQGDALSTNDISSPYHLSPPKQQDANFASQGSLDSVGQQGNKVSLLDLHDAEDYTESAIPSSQFQYGDAKNGWPAASATDFELPPGDVDACHDIKTKEINPAPTYESLYKIQEQASPSLTEGADCIALQTYKSNAESATSDPGLARVRLPEETNGQVPVMLDRFMEVIPYHSTALPMQENNEQQMSHFVRDLMKRTEDFQNDSSDYFIKNNSSLCDNNSKKKSHKRRKKSSSTSNGSGSSNNNSSSNNVDLKKNDDLHNFHRRPEYKALSSTREMPNELQTFVPPRTMDPTTYISEELPPHYFMEPKITPDLPTTDL